MLCYIGVLNSYSLLNSCRTCVLGTAHGWFLGLNQRNHVDQIIARFAQYTPRLEALEIQWDPDSIRFTDKSSKFIDLLRYAPIARHNRSPHSTTVYYCG